MNRLQDYEMSPWGALHQASSLRDFFSRALEWISEPSFLQAPWGRYFFTMEEEEERVIVKVELVGMKREDFEIELKDGLLTIGGQRKVDRRAKEGEPLRRERFFGKFSRSVSLPARVDESAAVTASYKEGVLVIILPKSEKAKPKKIAIHAN
jgi:HSP20 family protein